MKATISIVRDGASFRLECDEVGARIIAAGLTAGGELFALGDQSAQGEASALAFRQVAGRLRTAWRLTDASAPKILRPDA